MMPEDSQGNPGRVISVKKYDKTNEYPASYDDFVKLLRRMEAEGVVKPLGRRSRYEPVRWARPGTKDVSEPMIRHELACHKVLKAMWKYYPDRLTYWDWCRYEDERAILKQHKKGAVIYDRRFVFNGVRWYLEHEVGTNEQEVLERKLKRYIQLIESEGGQGRVLFSMQFERLGYSVKRRGEKLVENCEFILETAAKLKRKEFFYVALHSELVDDPAAPILVNAFAPEHPSTFAEVAKRLHA